MREQPLLKRPRGGIWAMQSVTGDMRDGKGVFHAYLSCRIFLQTEWFRCILVVPARAARLFFADLEGEETVQGRWRFLCRCKRSQLFEPKASLQRQTIRVDR